MGTFSVDNNPPSYQVTLDYKSLTEGKSNLWKPASELKPIRFVVDDTGEKNCNGKYILPK